MIRSDDLNMFGVNLPVKMELHRVEYFEKLLFDVVEEYQMKLPLYEISAKGLFLKLWIYLLREAYWNSNPEMFSIMEELVRIKDYLGNNVYKAVTLDELAEKFNISKYHLDRLFKKAFLISPIHYHQWIRIEKAKEMIQCTNRSFTQIAEVFGYGSINAFSRAFKNFDGVPPSFYRRRGID